MSLDDLIRSDRHLTGWIMIQWKSIVHGRILSNPRFSTRHWTMWNKVFLCRFEMFSRLVFSQNVSMPKAVRSITTAARVRLIHWPSMKNNDLLSIKLTKQLNIPSTARPKVERPVGSDDLYKRLCVEVRGHDPSVLDSYERFVRLVSTELDLNLVQV